MKIFTSWVLAGLLTLGAPARGQPAPSDPPDGTLAARVQACTLCHGREGRATRSGYFPRIAGKPEGYLFNQLRNFRDGRRPNPAMQHLLRHMTDDYLREIARYFSRLDLPYPPAEPRGLDEREQQLARVLVFQGAPQRQIPACVSCHGAQMAGRLPATPGLLTLPADYLIAQLGAWRTGQRRAAAPDCMADVARRLSPQEVGAVARWLSAQTLPAGIRPEAAGSGAPLPLRCGSGGP